MSSLDETPEVEAQKYGLVVVYPKDDELFLDIDNNEDGEWVFEILEILKSNGEDFQITKTTTSKSGNMHIYIRANRGLDPLERIALQACLGSDRKRELLSLLRLWRANRAPTVFFEKPEELKNDSVVG